MDDSKKIQEDINKFMANVVTEYNIIRGKWKKDSNFVFWDAIAISAVDESQEKAYEMQIYEKRKNCELPPDVPFHVFCDPPEHKIGCGGSAMFVLEKLLSIYNNAFQEMRILFIPAGGYSQRLPSWTALGKLFSPVPLNVTPMYHMLDLILAVYLPFLKRMSPGVFIASSDAIITYNLDDEAEWSFCQSGFTALAHPASLSIGLQHGVYVLPEENISEACTFMSDCIKVLQKPSEELMRESKAVVMIGKSEKREIIYCDSAFYFDAEIATKIGKLYEKNKPLRVEINAYGDFLQPLGSAANSNYIKPANVEESFMKLKLFDLLHGKPLSILVLNQSSFHHFGSMSEYIRHYNRGSEFSLSVPYLNFVFSSFVSTDPHENIHGTVMHSSLHPFSKIPQSSLVEYCQFDVPIEVGENSILSNCRIVNPKSAHIPVAMPANLLFHTVAVKEGFVTISFDLMDNLKKYLPLAEGEKLTFLNKNLGFFMKTIRPQIFDSTLESVSLWEAKLFPVCDTMDESFAQTLKLMKFILNSQSSSLYEVKGSHIHMSMRDILISKNIDAMLNYHRDLKDSIIKQAETVDDFDED